MIMIMIIITKIHCIYQDIDNMESFDEIDSILYD